MIFVDTGAFFALYYARDQHRSAAAAIWPTLPRPLFTSNHVLDELATLLARNIDYTFAADRLSDIFASPTFEILRTTAAEEKEAIRWMRKFADQQVSFTDCLSFTLMTRERLRTAFTFDRHFRAAGFQTIGA